MFLSSKTLLAASVAAFLPLSAAAVTVEADLVADEQYTFAEVLEIGGDVDFNFTVLEDLDISDFALSASGNNGGTDVGNVTFGFFDASTDTFDTVVVQGSVATGLDFLPSNGGLSANDTFSIFFNDGIEDAVSVTLSFNTTTPPAVPVPAAGLLLGSALLGGGFVARRKKKAA